MEKKYYLGLDVLRIIFACMVFSFHSNLFLNVKYSFFDGFVQEGAVFCSCFFILSGFTLQLHYGNKDMNNLKSIIDFYLKRIFAIVPVYCVVILVYDLFWGIGLSKMDIARLLPIDLIGLRCELLYLPNQNFFWFVSCIMLAYLGYPYIQIILKQMKTKSKVIMVIVIWILILYSTYVQFFYSTYSYTYYVPFYRFLEVIVGMIFSDFFNSIKMQKEKCNKVCFFTILIITSLIFLLMYYFFSSTFPGKWMYFDFFIIPCSGVIFITICMYNINLGKIFERVIRFLASISFYFYLFQTWVIGFFLNQGALLFSKMSNWERLFYVWVICFILSAVTHIIVKLIYKIINMKRKSQNENN